MYKFLGSRKEESVEVSNFNDNGIQTVSDNTEIAQTIKELNDDETQDSFSKIDMKTRLASIEISSIIALDSLVAFNFLPKEVGLITRSKKRLAVSLNGLGRDEIVQIAQGMKEQTQGKSIFDKMSGIFGGGK